MSHTDTPSTYVCPRCDQQSCICHWYGELRRERKVRALVQCPTCQPGPVAYPVIWRQCDHCQAAVTS